MMFSELAIGDTFDFDHSMLSSWSGAVGPWVKRTKRCYVRADNSSTQHFVVGTVRVEVVKHDKA
jgi:hypothetical protein